MTDDPSGNSERRWVCAYPESEPCEPEDWNDERDAITTGCGYYNVRRGLVPVWHCAAPGADGSEACTSAAGGGVHAHGCGWVVKDHMTAGIPSKDGPLYRAALGLPPTPAAYVTPPPDPNETTDAAQELAGAMAPLFASEPPAEPTKGHLSDR